MTHRLEVVALSCARGDRPLFTDLGFEAASGQLLHVVGPNGSGKTTLLRTICGLTRPAAGEIRWQGQRIQALGDEYRAQLVYVGHLEGIYGELTPPENLAALACQQQAHALEAAQVDAALERLGLERLRALPAKVLSQGQKRRLALARLLLAPGPLWILDEPYTALDTRSSELLNALLAEHLARRGIALVASHQPLALARATVRRIALQPAAAADSGPRAALGVDTRRPAGRQPA